jgi:hypothetical protein
MDGQCSCFMRLMKDGFFITRVVHILQTACEVANICTRKRGKVKGKIYRLTGHEGPKGEKPYSFLNLGAK